MEPMVTRARADNVEYVVLIVHEVVEALATIRDVSGKFGKGKVPQKVRGRGRSKSIGSGSKG